jgi:hypothetical protein
MAAAAWLQSGKLLSQLLRNEVVLVPELHNPAIRNPRQNGARRSAPIRRQYRFPDHQNRQVRGFLLLQDFFGCGGPPQTARSCRRQQKHHAGVRISSIKIAFELASIACQIRERRLALRRAPRPQEVPAEQKCQGQTGKPEHVLSLHDSYPSSVNERSS